MIDFPLEGFAVHDGVNGPSLQIKTSGVSCILFVSNEHAAVHWMMNGWRPSVWWLGGWKARLSGLLDKAGKKMLTEAVWKPSVRVCPLLDSDDSILLQSMDDEERISNRDVVEDIAQAVIGKIG